MTAESTISFPGIPLWLGIHKKVMNWETAERVMKRVCMRTTRDVGNGCQGGQEVRDDKERVCRRGREG